MIVLFKNGQSAWIHDGVEFEASDRELNIYGKRNKLLFTAQIDTVAGYFFEGATVTTYGFVDKADERVCE